MTNFTPGGGEFTVTKDLTESEYRQVIQQTLAPCPFCGNKNPALMVKIGRDGWRDHYYVLCDYCGAASGFYHYALEAAACWNRRMDNAN